MKKIYIILSATLLLGSCVNDLNILPPPDAEPMAENVYGKTEDTYLQGLAFLYFQFVTNDLTDLQQMDGCSQVFMGKRCLGQGSEYKHMECRAE